MLTSSQFASANTAVEAKAYLIEVDGAIGPVTHDLIARSIKKANADRAQFVILRMNTPGGLDYSTRQIITEILASPIPIITYVAPSGSRAASAGTYILYASHIAAMAPATNLGAATPVKIGGLPDFSPPAIDDENATEKKQAPVDNMEKKIVNDASAYIRGLAKLRGRNEQWAEKAVRDAVSLTASEALEQNVIELIAKDLSDLQQQLNGREITTSTGTVTLNTNILQIEIITPDWRSRILSIITDPNIAYILMLVGIYGLIIEFSNPGSILPGTVGAIALLLALYAFQILPINYVGLALLSLGLAFIIGEVFASTGGVLGLGGVIAFILGSVILFDDEHLAISLPLIGGTAAVAAGFLFWVLSKLATIRQSKVVSGMEYMIGQIGEATEDFEKEGRIHIEGESWLARSMTPVSAGEKVHVKAIDNLVLDVEPWRDV